MSDETAPSPVEDTPTPETETAEVEATPPVEGNPEVPGYEPDDSLQGDDRYKHLQAFATRTAQERAELREQLQAADGDRQFMDALRSGDQQAFRQIAEAFDADPEAVLRLLGLTEAEIDEALDEDTPKEFRDPRVDQLLAQQQEAETAQIAADLSDHIDQLAKDKNVELTKRQKQVIWIEAIDNGLTPEGTEKAFTDWYSEDYEPLTKRAVKSYRESKRAPSPPPSGSPGVPSPPTDRKSRLALANEVAQRAIDSSGA